MELTLSPNIEREAIAEIRHRKRDETAPVLVLKCLKLFANLFLHWSPKRFKNHVVEACTVYIEAKNDGIANHLRWFETATKDLATEVSGTGESASPKLGAALDELVAQIDSTVRGLLSFVEVLNARSRPGRAIHRSIRLLLEVRGRALEMKRVGQLAQPADAITIRIETATARMVEVHARALVANQFEPDPQLVVVARAATRRKARSANSLEVEKI
jgi:hypothetical protein